jgi:hypothetical protein
VIHSSGSVPRRSIRFVLFTGEEQGMLGSWAYARAHHAELDRTSAAILFDGGIGAVSGYSLAGRRDALAPVREALAPLAPMGVKDFTLDARINEDRFDFILEGILTIRIKKPRTSAPQGIRSTKQILPRSRGRRGLPRSPGMRLQTRASRLRGGSHAPTSSNC